MYKQKLKVINRYNSRKEFWGEFSDENTEDSDYLWSYVYQNESDPALMGLGSLRREGAGTAGRPSCSIDQLRAYLVARQEDHDKHTAPAEVRQGIPSIFTRMRKFVKAPWKSTFRKTKGREAGMHHTMGGASSRS